MLVFDTNVVSELMVPEPHPAFALWFEGQIGTEVATTIVTIAEITFGLARLPDGARRSRLESSFAALTGPQGPLPVLEMGARDARLCGQLRARREALGRPITFADALIAAIALGHDGKLATRNTRDFEGLGIDLIDPWGGF